jgi:hypothetical protein
MSLSTSLPLALTLSPPMPTPLHLLPLLPQPPPSSLQLPSSRALSLHLLLPIKLHRLPNLTLPPTLRRPLPLSLTLQLPLPPPLNLHPPQPRPQRLTLLKSLPLPLPLSMPMTRTLPLSLMRLLQPRPGKLPQHHPKPSTGQVLPREPPMLLPHQWTPLLPQRRQRARAGSRLPSLPCVCGTSWAAPRARRPTSKADAGARRPIPHLRRPRRLRERCTHGFMLTLDTRALRSPNHALSTRTANLHTSIYTCRPQQLPSQPVCRPAGRCFQSHHPTPHSAPMPKTTTLS